MSDELILFPTAKERHPLFASGIIRGGLILVVGVPSANTQIRFFHIYGIRELSVKVCLVCVQRVGIECLASIEHHAEIFDKGRSNALNRGNLGGIRGCL